MKQLIGYDWPGNAQELRGVIESAVLRTDSNGLPVELTSWTSPGYNGDNEATQTMAELERAHITRILERTGGVIQGSSGAARLLGLQPSTLRSRMSRLGIPRKPSDEGENP